MKHKIVFIGLGNPEPRYENTRHNVGFRFVEHVKDKILKTSSDKKHELFEIWESEDLILIKPLTGMNVSGRGVKAALKKLGLFPSQNYDWLYVAHDDLDINLGDYKLQFCRGPKCHHGIESIESELGTQNFWRLRLGVDNRPSNKKISGEDYVLQNFTEEEKKIIEKVIAKATSSMKI